MRLRLIPILITMSVTTTILFGSWFSFQHWGVSKPIESKVESLQGVEYLEYELKENEFILFIDVAPEVRLREINEVLEKKLYDILDGRNLAIRVNDNSSSQLDRWWGEHLFQVAEAMDLRKYASIPKDLKEISDDFNNAKAIVEIDEVNVYVQLYEGDHYKFIVLPRETRMGVWNG
jgi:hypothetical protein